MSDAMSQQINQIVAQSSIPAETAITPEATRRYEQATEILDTYRGHPQVLFDALRAYLATGSRPYAYAGIARVLSAAAFEHDDLYDQKTLTQALDWLQRAQEIVPDRNDVNLVEAILYLHMKRYQDARTVLDHLGQAGTPDYHFCLTEMSYWDAQRDIPRVEQWYHRAVALTQTEDQRTYLLEMFAGVYLMNKMQDQALPLYERLVQIKPDNPWAWHNASVILYRQKNYDRAEQFNRRALQIMDFGAARNIQALIAYGRGKNAYEMGEFAEAARHFTQAIQADDSLREAFRHRGLARSKTGDRKGALADFAQAIQLDPKFLNAYYNRGTLYLDMKDYNRAIDDFTQAILIEPDNKIAYFSRANAFRAKGELDRALTDYSVAIRLDANYANAYNNRGLTYEKKGDRERALADYEIALRLDPRMQIARKNREELLKRKKWRLL